MGKYKIDDPNRVKKCAKCGEVKHMEDYYIHKIANNIYPMSRCKKCLMVDQAIRYHTDENFRKKWTNRKSCKQNSKEWRKSMQKIHPEKFEARWLVRDALERGTLKKEPCSVCGEIKSEAHHNDYFKPLEVEWYCHAHHMEHHRRYDINALVKEVRQ